MIGSYADAVRATAVVFHGGVRKGSAVMVDHRHLLTAAHVLRDGRESLNAVEVLFPGVAPPQGVAARLTARRIRPLPGGEGLDAAVLDLGQRTPGWLPDPVALSPRRRLPATVGVFGFPKADVLTGVWRTFTVSGPTAVGSFQMDWADQAGTLPGHSGGPVLDSHLHTVVGILVEGSDAGRFDRFIPIDQLSRAWPQLRRPWLMVNAEQIDARSHMTSRARGQRSVARGGDLFCGREAALDAVTGWLSTAVAPQQVLVVTGQPGAGKSSVVARAVFMLEQRHSVHGLAFHARGASADDLVTALADVTGVETATSPEEMVELLAELPEQPGLPLVVDGLDEAASDVDRRRLADLLVELGALPGLRVAVATRGMSTGQPYIASGLLRALGVIGPSSDNLIDLDNDRYFDPAALTGYAAALLAQQGVERPGPPGRAWEIYRRDHRLRYRLAAVIAARARRNFLVAALSAVPLSTEPTVLDPQASGFVTGQVGEIVSISPGCG